MPNLDIFKPIRIVGYCLLISGLSVLIVHLFLLGDTGYSLGFQFFMITNSFVQIFTGLGVILQKKWGYYLFKIVLYWLCLAFPIGTYIAFKGLKYLKVNKLERFFE